MQVEIINVLRDAMMVSFKLAAPMLIISMVVGLIIAIFQAATQIHEQTLTFVPKVVTIALLLFFSASWMIATFSDFIHRVFAVMANVPNL